MSLSNDRTALDALYMVHNQGCTQKDVRVKYGLSKGSVAGFFSRDRQAHDEDPTKHLNGTMPDRWWNDGLRARNG